MDQEFKFLRFFAREPTPQSRFRRSTIIANANNPNVAAVVSGIVVISSSKFFGNAFTEVAAEVPVGSAIFPFTDELPFVGNNPKFTRSVPSAGPAITNKETTKPKQAGIQ